MTGKAAQVAERAPGVDATVEGQIAAFGLSGPIAELTRGVVRRTRLWRRERADLARELASHFAEGLAAGRSEREMIESFGDASAAARLIRRAVKRRRPAPWRALALTAKATGIAILCFVGVFVVLTARFMMGSPTVTRNYTAELNARYADVPPETLAWPLYVRAIPAFTRESDVFRSEWPLVRSGDDVWQTSVEWLRANADVLAMVREAASRPTLGCNLSNAYDPDYAAAKAAAMGEDFEFQPPQENPMMLNVLLPHLGDFRNFGRTLVQDAIVAAHEGDGERVVANMVALSGIASHAAETPLLISSLVAAAITSMQSEFLRRLLTDYPRVFSDSDLRDLAHLLGSAQVEATMRADFETERIYFDDFMQRAYTDNGRGGGRLTPEGFRLLSTVESVSVGGFAVTDESLIAETALGWLAMVAVADRRTTLVMHDRLMGEAHALTTQPLWRMDTSRFDALVENFTSTPLRTARFLPVVWVTPAVPRLHASMEIVRSSRDATLVVIALELHRRRHGAYPASLDELVPVFLPAVPPDRFDGNPLRYILRDGQPLLYSIGVDGIDDGGVPPRKGPRGVGQWSPPAALERSLATQLGRDRQSGDWVLWPTIDRVEE